MCRCTRFQVILAVWYNPQMAKSVEQELSEATQNILDSGSRKKLVVAGPGAGKTYLFKKLLEQSPGERENRIVLTFVNNLKNDLEQELGDLAQVFTLHGYCQHLLYREKRLRGGLSSEFRCYPKLTSLIKQDWKWLKRTEAPKFIAEMRSLDCPADHESFYIERGDYYDAVDFDDSVYRVHEQLLQNPDLVSPYELVLIDEFQDFNRLEAGIIDLLAQKNAIIIAGDDDQALYSKLRDANWDFIRSYHEGSDYDVFPLPFCMRCTEVIVGAVNDIIVRARADGNLEGRIDKPYRFYEPLKGEDSRLYPKIDLVRTTVQRNNANYFGRYIEKAIRAIPEADIEAAKEKNEPVALVIGSRPYLPQVEQHLIGVGVINENADQSKNEREQALEILHADPASNLGWRIILACGDAAIAADRVVAATEQGVPLTEVIPEEERASVLQEAEELMNTAVGEEDVNEVIENLANIKLTSFEGSKGLSAQYVFIIGLHSGDLPRAPDNIQDIEICRFLVGLTRAKKKCSLIYTQRFANNMKTPSPFLDWIDDDRYDQIRINAAYWN